MAVSLKLTPSQANGLWISQRGIIACPQHGGGYLEWSVDREPNALEHTTPLDSWMRLTDRADLAHAYCDECGKRGVVPA
jgi:hypothetical protein